MRIDPYTVVGLAPMFRTITERSQISANLDHIEELSAAAISASSLDIPVRLLVLPEGALQGFGDESADVDHTAFATTCAIDIPGPETERLGRLAKKFNIFIMGQAKARHPEWPKLFFNVGFIISPEGEVIHTHYKLDALLPVERSVSPHDLFDWWVERYGRTLDAFWPVARTEIGNLGVMMAMEGMRPENGRGLALNGAEVVYRASLPTPFTENDIFEITNRSRAIENNFYVVAPNIGGELSSVTPGVSIDSGGGRSMIVNHRGTLVGKQFDSNGATFVSGVIDIEALRYHRDHAQVTNWLKDVRTEMAQIIYEKPIYPKNRYLDAIPPHHAEFRRTVIDAQIAKMHEIGAWTPYE